jgi:integral membrane protein (TIGR01906 family)
VQDRLVKHDGALAVVRVLLAICAPIFIMFSNLYLLFTPQYVRFEYSRPGFPASYVYDSGERLRLADATLHYLRSSEDADSLASLQSQGAVVYNSRELKHMVDVKVVLQTVLQVHAVAVFLCAVSLFLLWRPPRARRSTYQALINGCMGFIGIMAAVAVVSYLRFDVFFTAFHRVLFAGDSWLFSYDDTLIQLFPLQFWIESTWLLSLLTVAECVLVTACCWWQLRQYRNTA